MIEVQDLSRHYGDFTAVSGISFSVDEGEILGMLGPNGAGKTTTIRMITGFLPPSWGRVTVAGYDLGKDSRKARRELGYLPENVALYPEMRVEEYLRYRARLEGMPRREIRAAVDEVLDRCWLDEVRRQVIGTLSKGYRQRVGLASAILHRPRVLVLDEPTVGLDPGQIVAIRELIRELGREHTLLLSTHILPEVDLLCDRVVIIDRGEIVDQGTPDELRGRASAELRLEVVLRDNPEGAEEAFATLPGVRSVSRSEREPERLILQCDGSEVPGGFDPRAVVFQAAVAGGWVLLELVPRRISLEDVFVRLTTHESPLEPESLAAGSSIEEQSEIDPTGEEVES